MGNPVSGFDQRQRREFLTGNLLRNGNHPVVRSKIVPQPWMTSPETAAVIAALTADGTEVRFVGGCVRDAVSRRVLGDIDIATPQPPERVMERLAGAGIRVIPTGLGHGTVTALVGDRRFEITTLRVDVETDGRRARVAFTDDWTADAARRDFTINALSCTLEGDVYDPFGGLEDLGQGRVRFVGNPRRRIEEDVLRLLRFFRFYAYFGRPPPDCDALAACRAMASRLPDLSGERVRAELFRILLAPEPADVIVLMRGERVLEHVLPEAGGVGRLRVMAWLETRAVKRASVVADPLRRLAALLDTTREGADGVAHRLRLSNSEKGRLATLAVPSVEVAADMDRPALRGALYRLGAETVRDLALLEWAGAAAVAPRQPRMKTRGWQDVLAAAESWTPVEFPLKGRDALALGVPAGPKVGGLVRAVEAWWEDGDFRADRDACLEKLRVLAGS